MELGWPEVHAYAVPTTQVHLLVRSSEGTLPLEAMPGVFRCYVGRFNRSLGAGVAAVS